MLRGSWNTMWWSSDGGWSGAVMAGIPRGAGGRSSLSGFFREVLNRLALCHRDWVNRSELVGSGESSARERPMVARSGRATHVVSIEREGGREGRRDGGSGP